MSIFIWAVLIFYLCNIRYVDAQPELTYTSQSASSTLSSLHHQITQQYPTILNIADKRQWHQLLHYRQHPLSFKRRYRSQNDDTNFFLHPEGAWNPQAELLASIAAMSQFSESEYFSTSGKTDEQADKDQLAQCRFPARFYWLKQQLPGLPWVDHPCEAFAVWQDTLQAHSVTLIFPASHINSPSSMYGHTLLRFDKQDPTANKLLSYSANFAAQHDPTDGELAFSYKGLTGGYPGRISVEPYYVKTNQYQKMEYRDTWEYALSLDADEVAQLVRHIWEIKDSSFDYFFFDENCSYRLLTLIDASSERSDLADHFKFKALPVDTIRALQRAQLVEHVRYRPSAASDMEWAAGQVDPIVNQIARQLVDEGQNPDLFENVQAQDSSETGEALKRQDMTQYGDDVILFIENKLAALSRHQQAQALELAVAYARYLVVKKKYNQIRLRPLTLALLSARSDRPTDIHLLKTPTPEHRDDQGHASQRYTVAVVNQQQKVSGGSEQNTNPQSSPTSMIEEEAIHSRRTLQSVDLGFRLAFHDITDPVSGFVAGSQIDMGNVTFRLTPGGDEYSQAFREYSSASVKLQQLTFVDVLSLTPLTHYQSPVSWGVRASLERDIVDRGLYGQLGLRFGRSWNLGDSQFFALLHSETGVDNQFTKGYRLQFGSDMGWLYQGNRWQALVQWQWRPLSGGRLFGLGQHSRQSRLHLFGGFRLSQNLQIGIQYDYQRLTESRSNSELNHRAQQWKLQIARYF